MLFLLLLVAGGVRADGILLPGPITGILPDEPYFAVKYHRVKTEIKDQLCTTYVDQVFVNRGHREMEATYVFPLPAGAVVQKFTLTADGQEIPARLMDKDEAQRLYEDIVRRRRDPALLTYAGNNAYQAKIYPIPAGGERRIEIRYTQLLSYDNGLVSYLYPLSTEKFSSEPIKEVSFVADLESAQPLGSVYSPSHDVSITRKDDKHVRVSYEETGTRPDRDLLLYFNLAKDPVGLSLVTFKEPGKNGFFLLLAAPTVEQEAATALPKHVVFVMDTSGSMSGEKIKQVQGALTYCVNSLNPQDQFDIVAFSDHPESFAPKMVAADEEHVKSARKFIAGFEARGGTDIQTALQTALALRTDGDANYLVFLTDGQPTVGETDTEKILQQVGKLAPTGANPTRAFVFGVGYDVNTNFLDRMAQGHGGLSTYVRPSEDIEQSVSSFFGKIAQPRLTNLTLDWGGAEIYDAFPRQLPDLFAGSQIEMFGRYRQSSAGATKLTLSGTTAGGSRHYVLNATLPEVCRGTDYLASLWAARKIGFLLDEIRLQGQKKELVDEVVRLSLEYGILTQYTAFLALEGEAVPAGTITDRVSAAPMMQGPAGAAGPAGPAQVAASQNGQNLQLQTKVGANNNYVDESGAVQRLTNVQNLGQRGYVQRGARWEDMRYQPPQKIALQVQAYSEAYFQLSRAFPEMNAALSLGDKLLLEVNGQAVEVGTEGRTRLSDADLAALAAGKAPAGG
jgi:Ca-activated chloride channel family protein